MRTVIPTADRQKATVKVRATFDALDPRILPDMGVKVTFLGAAPTTPAAGRVLVPKGAIRDDGGKPIVFVVRDGRAERRAIKPGDARGNEIEVLAGLADGESIVVGGAKDLRDGQRVAVKR